MYKTVFAVNQEGQVESRMSVEWPEGYTADGIKTLAELRGEGANETLKLLMPQDVVEFCSAYQPMMLRIRYANLRGPYVVNSEEIPTDAQLAAHAKQLRKQPRKTTND